MKKIIFIFMAATLIIGCSSGPKPSEPNYLPPIKAEIPTELQDNEDIVKYINSTTDALNDVSKELEDLFVKIEPYADIPESEISTMDKLRISKYVIQFTAEMAKLGAKMALMKESYHMISGDLSPEEDQALMVINQTFLKRVQQLNEKYKDLDNFGVEINEENESTNDSVQE